MTVRVTIRVDGAASRASRTSALLGREQRLADDADHARPLVRAVVLDQGVEAILRPERVAHGRAAQARPADRPGSGRHRERALGEDRLMRAMEGAEAQVDDADVGVERRGGRPSHLGRDVPKSVRGKGGPSYLCLDSLILQFAAPPLAF